jgi:hypothetical protein
MEKTLLALMIALALVFHLRRMWLKKLAILSDARIDAARTVASVLTDCRDAPNGTIGVSTWTGTWRGERAQIRTIVDTLAVRKLPAFWLSVTIAEPIKIETIFDMMMRPGTTTTFSNFDLLPVTLLTPSDFPQEAVIRTDRPDAAPPLDVISQHIGLFAEGRAKELLITPNGVRIVWLLAEADRARYGVLRQAEFGEVGLDAERINALLEVCASLRAEINKTVQAVAA